MTYRSFNNRNLSPNIFEHRVRSNPYTSHIYSYPDIIFPDPEPRQLQNIWLERGFVNYKVHVEIGCGSGKYISEMALRFTEHYFIGLELRYKRLVKAANKIRRNGCTNIFLLRERGENLEKYLKQDSIDYIHINFPDPWAKKSQKKHRLLNPFFFKTASSLLKSKGILFFKTDHREYFESVLEMLKSFPEYKIVEQTEDLHCSVYNENNIETEFEMLFKSKSNPPINYMQVQLIR